MIRSSAAADLRDGDSLTGFGGERPDSIADSSPDPTPDPNQTPDPTALELARRLVAEFGDIGILEMSELERRVFLICADVVNGATRAANTETRPSV